MSSKFSCVIPGMERFSFDLLQAVKNRECALEVGCWVCYIIDLFQRSGGRVGGL